jgi:hypothetical protein
MFSAKWRSKLPLSLTMMVLLLSLGVALSAFTASSLIVRATPSKGFFNEAGNLLITDQFNNRVIEVDANKNIIWSFGSGDPGLCDPGPRSVIGANSAERLAGGLTLIAGTGIPGASPALPHGCVDNRVVIVNAAKKIIWQYGQAGITGSDANELNTPVFAIQLPNSNILIVDQGNNRVIEVSLLLKTIVWSYGPASGVGALNTPNGAELLPNGHILIADENNNRAIEVTRSGQIVWQYSLGLQTVAFASRLSNGDTLITDSGQSRVVEINSKQEIVWQYFTNTNATSNQAPLPTNAVRLKDGNTSIADQFNNRVVIVNSKLQVVFQYGLTNVMGDGPNQLNGPYTAFVIGDYTGQTPPPSNVLIH